MLAIQQFKVMFHLTPAQRSPGRQQSKAMSRAAVALPLGNSPGIITINGDYTQSVDSVLEIEVGGLTPGPGSPNIDDGHDQVHVGGLATLAGRYDFPISNGFVPSAGDSITFIDTFGTGSIAAGTRPKDAFAPGLEDADPALAFRVVSSPSEVRLEFVDKSEIFFKVHPTKAYLVVRIAENASQTEPNTLGLRVV